MNAKSHGVNFKVIPERTNFKALMAVNTNYFGNFPWLDLQPVKPKKNDTSYEEICSIGYNPSREEMEAIVEIKRPGGYSGNLCTNGSFEHLRFYLDFKDGNGFIDQGDVRINVHNIPSELDCTGGSIFPLNYSAKLKKISNFSSKCSTPLLPTLRVILSWNLEPPANTPDWEPTWGSVKECDVQIKARLPFLIDPVFTDFQKFLEVASINPNLTSKQLIEITGVELPTTVQKESASLSPEFLKNLTNVEDATVKKRALFKPIQKMMLYPNSHITLANQQLLSEYDFDLSKYIDDLVFEIPEDKTKANVSFEELDCIGLDNHTESLVATIRIKKNSGYSGDLCSNGSTEYVAFWIDWGDNCDWKYLDTVKLKVHDIKMESDHLCYSVALPLDTNHYKQLCTSPNIVRARAVLSWNTAPSVTDPDKLEFYGNRVDSHVQIKPGVTINPGDVFPYYNIIGGIDVDHINNFSGLTENNPFFAFNGKTVPTDAPFGGLIVVNGPTFLGQRYRIKQTNLGTGVITYPQDSFVVVGSTGTTVTYTNQQIGIDGYYPFLSHDENTLSVLARFTPGTEDRLLVEIEVKGIPGSFGQIIQMDNTKPDTMLEIDDDDQCNKYKLGDTITGRYKVYDKHIDSWSFASAWGGNASGTSNTSASIPVEFSIPTSALSNPCGSVSLDVYDKTIYDSQHKRYRTYKSRIICLQKP